MNSKISMELVLHRINQSKEELNAGKLLYKEKYYKSANWPN